MSDDFIADYHEKKEAWPIVFNLGRIALEWSMLEQFFTGLIWQMLGDQKVGMAVTGGLGNQSKADILRGLAREQPNSDAIIEDIDFACKAFNILRESRNLLIHSHSIFPTREGSISWVRATEKGPHGHLATLASPAELEDLIEAIVHLGIFSCDLLGSVNAARDGRPTVPPPQRFPMPKKLQQISWMTDE